MKIIQKMLLFITKLKRKCFSYLDLIPDKELWFGFLVFFFFLDFYTSALSLPYPCDVYFGRDVSCRGPERFHNGTLPTYIRWC